MQVIEIKNVCPFREAPTSAHNHRGRNGYHKPGGYIVADPGPPAAFPPQHVPQLQLEMLAAGCGSGLLAVQSATRGVAVWRLYRDDSYIAELLRQVGRFYCDFVVSGRSIPEEVGRALPNTDYPPTHPRGRIIHESPLCARAKRDEMMVF